MEAGLGRGGIEAGFGRGIPPPWVCRWPAGVMPNGLLPPLRGPGRADGDGRGDAAGAPPRGGTKLGPGLGDAATPPSPCGWRRCFAACWAALTAAACSALSAAARTSASGTSLSWALAGLMVGADACGGVGTAAALAAARLGGAGFAVVVGAFSSVTGAAMGGGVGAGVGGAATNTSRNRLATGASTVLDADLTNSPISLSLASTILLSTPSSFASSCTRALPATALLTPRSRRAGLPAATSLVHLKPDHFSDFIVCSCRSSYLAVRVGHSRPTNGCSGLEVIHQRTGVNDTSDTQGTPKGAPTFRQRETCQIGMHVRAPTGLPTCRVGHDNAVLVRYDPQQLGGWRASPATHTCACR